MTGLFRLLGFGWLLWADRVSTNTHTTTTATSSTLVDTILFHCCSTVFTRGQKAGAVYPFCADTHNQFPRLKHSFDSKIISWLGHSFNERIISEPGHSFNWQINVRTLTLFQLKNNVESMAQFPLTNDCKAWSHLVELRNVVFDSKDVFGFLNIRMLNCRFLLAECSCFWFWPKLLTTHSRL